MSPFTAPSSSTFGTSTSPSMEPTALVLADQGVDAGGAEFTAEHAASGINRCAAMCGGSWRRLDVPQERLRQRRCVPALGFHQHREVLGLEHRGNGHILV